MWSDFFCIKISVCGKYNLKVLYAKMQSKNKKLCKSVGLSNMTYDLFL